MLATITDKKLQVSTNTTSTAYFEADVQTVQDYYAFGMQMPGRIFNSSLYRYGAANGQEKSTEIHENSYTAEFWQYDARLVRRWNVDPVKKAYESPFAAFGNNPIWLSDVNGADTTLPAADGKSIILPTGATFETFQANTKYKHASNGKEVSITSGGVSAFSVDGNRYTARFDPETLAFTGYQDKEGKSILQANDYYPTLNTVGLFAQTSMRFNFSVRLNSYLIPLAETKYLFDNSLISKSMASKIRYDLTITSRKLLDPLGKAFSGGLKSDATAWKMYQNFISNPNANAASIFKTKSWVTQSTRLFSNVPVLQISVEGYSYYTIIRQKKSIDQVEDDYDNWGNPIFKFYRNVIEKPLRKVGEK
jgi:hypothetical protein